MKTANGWAAKPDNPPTQVPWLSVDPFQPDLQSCPRFKQAQGFEVHLHKGDVLYLPALWFHAVKQTTGSGPSSSAGDGQDLAIAVNWWFDMDYSSPVWTLHGLVRKLSKAIDGRAEDESE